MSQSLVHIDVKSLPSYHPSGSDIYMAGSFNGWNPQDEKFKFQKSADGNYFIDIKLENGVHAYKVTRGSWDKVECKKDGAVISNRTLKVEGDLKEEISIEEWQDRFPTKPKTSTASKNVHIIDTAFVIPQLNRVRKVWIYLPQDYSTSGKKYPVLYMHDGQNVFDDATSYAGEWGVDEFLDSIKTNQCIVVAIDHGNDKRMHEYNPYDHDRFGKGEGDQYVDFIAKTLKPYIDKHYRVKKGKENTFIAGASMGGLISMYAILKYPKKFGGAGVFSPSFWIAPNIYDKIKRSGKKVKGRIYFYAGKLESREMVPDMLKVMMAMSKVSKAKMTTVIRDDGKHNEPTWRREFPLFFFWMKI